MFGWLLLSLSLSDYSMAAPLVRASFTSGSLLLLGDLLCQRVSHKRDSAEPFRIDYNRSARFALAGFTLHGPIFHYGFILADKTAAKMISLSKIQAVIYKTLLLQLTVFPLYLCTLFPMMGMLEGRGLGKSIQRTKTLVGYCHIQNQLLCLNSEEQCSKCVPRDTLRNEQKMIQENVRSFSASPKRLVESGT